MLVPDIALRAIRDRTPHAAVIGAVLAVGTAGMIATGRAMRGTFDDLTDDLPEAYAGIIGSTEGNYVVTSAFGLLAPIAILVVAISAGTRAFAREENRRTADLLLALPVARRDVVLSRAAVLVANVALASALLAVGGALGAALIDLDGVTPGLMVAGSVHVCFLGFAFGMIALAASNISGSATLGTGLAVGVAVVSNLAAGVLPLVDSLAWAKRLSPWYYFNGSDPIVNGVDVVHLVVLTAISCVAFAVAYAVVETRDVGSYRGGRRRSMPALGLLTRPRVSTIFTKSLSERSTLLAIVASGLVAMSVAVAAMYSALEDTLADFSERLPDSLVGLIGTTELGTPAGWMQAEMLSIVVPVSLVGVAVVIGIDAIAGEDDRHTLSLLLAGPVSRRAIVIEKAAALVVGLAAVGAMIVVALWLGSAVGGLGLEAGKMLAAAVHVTALAVFFGAFALAAGARWSKRRALQITIGIAVVAYLADWLLGISDATDAFAALSPWFYMSDAQALIDGVDLGHLGVLGALSAAAIVTAAVAFERRDIAS